MFLAQQQQGHSIVPHVSHHPPPAVVHPSGHPQAAAVASAASAAQVANSQKYLNAAYRVGMLALECLGKRINEDRPQAKFAKVPSYGEDVKWLHAISQKLGELITNSTNVPYNSIQ